MAKLQRRLIQSGAEPRTPNSSYAVEAPVGIAHLQGNIHCQLLLLEPVTGIEPVTY